jgi:peptidoglycan L-alanyl-D-glutamate endopeptidase CwlK
MVMMPPNLTNWPEVASWGKVFGLDWGGSWNSFKDYPHFQMTFGQTWQQLYKQSQ